MTSTGKITLMAKQKHENEKTDTTNQVTQAVQQPPSWF